MLTELLTWFFRGVNLHTDSLWWPESPAKTWFEMQYLLLYVLVFTIITCFGRMLAFCARLLKFNVICHHASAGLLLYLSSFQCLKATSFKQFSHKTCWHSRLMVSYMCQRLVFLQQMQLLILVQTTCLQHQSKVLNVAQREPVLQGGDYILEGNRWKQMRDLNTFD